MDASDTKATTTIISFVLDRIFSLTVRPPPRDVGFGFPPIAGRDPLRPTSPAEPYGRIEAVCNIHFAVFTHSHRRLPVGGAEGISPSTISCATRQTRTTA